MKFIHPLLALVALTLCGCHSMPEVPKPKAYLRIDLPPVDYRPTQTVLPFSFEQNQAAEVVVKKREGREVWVDMVYPQFDGVVFLTYKQLGSVADLRGQTDTSLRLMEKHYKLSSGIEEQGYNDPMHRIYATTYRLKGNNVASTYQFWATDSNTHFLRGAVYINRQPNNDSLAPVINYIQSDIDHLIETLRWE